MKLRGIVCILDIGPDEALGHNAQVLQLKDQVYLYENTLKS